MDAAPESLAARSPNSSPSRNWRAGLGLPFLGERRRGTHARPSAARRPGEAGSLALVEFRSPRRTRERDDRRAAELPPGALTMLRSMDDRQQIDGFGEAIGGVVADYELLDPPDEKRAIRWNFAMTPRAFISASCRPAMR